MAAMKGRIDAIDLVLKLDTQKSIWTSIYKNSQAGIHSLAFVSLLNDELECAKW